MRHTKAIARQSQGRSASPCKEFHSQRPESPGIGVDELYQASGLAKNVFDGMKELMGVWPVCFPVQRTSRDGRQTVQPA